MIPKKSIYSYFESHDTSLFIENKLPYKQRKNLDDSDFGIPELRKYPLTDLSHVKSAIRMFNYVDKSHEKELASAIKRKIKEYNIDISNISDKNRLKKYL